MAQSQRRSRAYPRTRRRRTLTRGRNFRATARKTIATRPPAGEQRELEKIKTCNRKRVIEIVSGQTHVGVVRQRRNNMPNGDNARPTTARRVLVALTTFGANVWSFIRRWFWQGLCAAFVLAFILVVVRPFAPSEDPNEADVAVKWNQSIAKLGILPIYPPEEDFYVGDVWGIISEADIDKPN